MPRVSQHWTLQDPRFGSVIFQMSPPTTIAADSNQTLTAAQVVNGFIVRGASMSAARTDTLPTAAALVEYCQGVQVYHWFELIIRNAAAGAYAITLAAGAGGTMSPTSPQVAQNNTKFWMIQFTNVTLGQEAYTAYSLGSATT